MIREVENHRKNICLMVGNPKPDFCHILGQGAALLLK